jgi:hypothetical protein
MHPVIPVGSRAPASPRMQATIVGPRQHPRIRAQTIAASVTRVEAPSLWTVVGMQVSGELTSPA